MTPKEKAKELVDKYKPIVNGYVGSSMLTNTEYPETILANAKRCALIAVDEIILTTFKKETWYRWNIIPQKESTTEYWQQVKNELNKL